MKNFEKSVLFIPTNAFSSQVHYEASLIYKMHIELNKYYNATYYIIFYKNTKFDRSSYSENFHLIHLKLNWSNPIDRLINIILMYWNNFKFIRKHKNINLIWIGLTSDISNSFAFLYPLLFPNKKFYVQLYTPSVNKSKLKRDLLDFILRINLKVYKYIGGGNSELNKTRYNIPDKKNIPVEIGMPDYGFIVKDFSDFKMVYIGTLQNREIWKSVKGLGIFLLNNKDLNISYDIIGSGSKPDVDKIQSEINYYNLGSRVTLHGKVSIERVKELFKYCNIGVSYVPVNLHNQNKSTKTIEYFLAGMAVIATNNKVRKELVTHEFGVLCEDNPESFAYGLQELYNKRNLFNSLNIRNKFKDFGIESTIQNKYVPYINKIIND